MCSCCIIHTMLSLSVIMTSTIVHGELGYIIIVRPLQKFVSVDMFWKIIVGGAEVFFFKIWIYDMFKKITMQTKSQGKVIDILNKPHDNNYCKNAKNKCYLLSTPLFFENSTDILHFFSISKKKKKKKGGFQNFRIKKIF